MLITAIVIVPMSMMAIPSEPDYDKLVRLYAFSSLDKYPDESLARRSLFKPIEQSNDGIEKLYLSVERYVVDLSTGHSPIFDEVVRRGPEATAVPDAFDEIIASGREHLAEIACRESYMFSGVLEDIFLKRPDLALRMTASDNWLVRRASTLALKYSQPRLGRPLLRSLFFDPDERVATDARECYENFVGHDRSGA
jgi:hypothetical protein